MATAILADAPDRVEIRPQPGPQELFMATPADIGIIGGSVHGGKTFALTAEPLRHVHVPGFTFVAFRRVTPEIRNPGGMWDESMKMYPTAGGHPRADTLEWRFPSGAWGKMASLQHETDVLGWKGSQVCLILFDQLESFSAPMFFYMLARNRSTCGVRPYLRASCNPDPDSFLADLLAWWIEPDSGYAIRERSGWVRFFIRRRDDIVWSSVTAPPGVSAQAFARYETDARADLDNRFPGQGRFSKSLTFVLARLQDNVIGNRLDPGYEASVRALPHVEQERLLGGDRGGNWKIRAAAGLVFNRGWYEIVGAQPTRVVKRVRAWDKAATAGGGDWTVGVRMAKTVDGLFYVEDVIRGQWASGDREAVIRQAAQLDGPGVTVLLEQEPGSSGVDSAKATIRNLAGFTAIARPSSGDKIERANPYAAQAQVGNVKLVAGAWNDAYIRELHAFPTKGTPDDQVDASSAAFRWLSLAQQTVTNPSAWATARRTV